VSNGKGKALANDEEVLRPHECEVENLLNRTHFFHPTGSKS